MGEWYVGSVDEFQQDDSRKIVDINGKNVGVIFKGGKFYAFENVCVHQGGPVCEGKILPKVEVVLGENKQWVGDRFSDKEIHLICPWHGWEFNIETGEAAGLKTFRLKKYRVETREGGVYVID